MGLTPYGKEDSVYDKSDKQFDSDDMTLVLLDQSSLDHSFYYLSELF